MSLAGFRDKNEIRIFALLAVTFAFFLSFGQGRTQGARVMAHARALLYEGRNTIDTSHWNTIDKSYCQGHYYTCAAPGMGYLAVAPLAVFEGLYSVVPQSLARKLNERTRMQLEHQCRLMIEQGYLSFDPAVNKVDLFRFHAAIWFFALLIALCMAAGAVVFYRVLLLFEVEPPLASLSALVLGAGTILLFYARIPYALVPVACLLVLAFYLVVLAHKEPGASAKTQATRLLLAGLVLGLAVALEYIQIIGAALIFLYAWHKVGTRRIWLVAAGGLPLGLLIMLYHYSAFGSPFAFPYKFAIPILAMDQQQKLLEIDHPTWERLLAISFGPRRGLFVYDPVLLLFAFLFVKDLWSARRHVAESLLGLSLLAAYLVFQASSPVANIVWGVGPRYAAGMVPFLMLGVILLRSSWERKAFYWLTGLSILISWLMVQHDIESQHHAFPLGDAVSAFLRSGPSSSFLEITLALAGRSNSLASWAAGFAAYAVLAGVLLWIWRQTKVSSVA